MSIKILLADDSLTIQKVVELTFSDAETRLMAVGSGDKAVQALDEFQPDIVLADVVMPRMDGRQAFEAIHRTHPEIPVILSSGYNEQETIQRFHSEGLAAFIQKPYPVHELRELISRVLTPRNRVGGPPVRD